jgi:calcineurin-like phosphoesterase family protein
MWYFSGDQHWDHNNILKYEPNRAKFWNTVEEMNQGLINNWNSVVKGSDVVVFAGDLTLHYDAELVRYRFIQYLNGNKIFVKGNHDYWLKDGKHIYHHKVEGQFVAVSHYPMRSWNRSNHGSWNLHGHTHSHLTPFKNQLDVGVDNAYLLVGVHRPLSFDEVKYFIEQGQKDGNYSENEIWESTVRDSNSNI